MDEKPGLKRILKKILKVGVAICGSVAMVVRWPRVAISFIVARFSKGVSNTYTKIIAGALMAIAAAFLLQNVAEVAVLLCVFALLDALTQWGECISNA